MDEGTTSQRPSPGAGTALCGIVLHPSAHTRSPAMHNAAYRALALDAVYLAFDVPPAALAAAVAGLRTLRARQFAVSIPHKEAVTHLDAVDDTARRIGAVNTVTLRDGRLVGTNTDCIGAVRALERETHLAGKRAVVLGAGGTARAAVFGLCERGARVAVLGRTPDRARALAGELGADAAGGIEELARTPYDVLVNTTPVGLRSVTHRRSSPTRMNDLYSQDDDDWEWLGKIFGVIALAGGSVVLLVIGLAQWLG